MEFLTIKLLEVLPEFVFLWDSDLTTCHMDDSSMDVGENSFWHQVGCKCNITGKQAKRIFATLRKIFDSECQLMETFGGLYKPNWKFFAEMQALQTAYQKHKTTESWSCDGSPSGSICEIPKNLSVMQDVTLLAPEKVKVLNKDFIRLEILDFALQNPKVWHARLHPFAPIWIEIGKKVGLPGNAARDEFLLMRDHFNREINNEKFLKGKYEVKWKFFNAMKDLKNRAYSKKYTANDLICETAATSSINSRLCNADNSFSQIDARDDNFHTSWWSNKVKENNRIISRTESECSLTKLENILGSVVPPMKSSNSFALLSNEATANVTQQNHEEDMDFIKEFQSKASRENYKNPMLPTFDQMYNNNSTDLYEFKDSSLFSNDCEKICSSTKISNEYMTTESEKSHHSEDNANKNSQVIMEFISAKLKALPKTESIILKQKIIELLRD